MNALKNSYLGFIEIMRKIFTSGLGTIVWVTFLLQVVLQFGCAMFFFEQGGSSTIVVAVCACCAHLVFAVAFAAAIVRSLE